MTNPQTLLGLLDALGERFADEVDSIRADLDSIRQTLDRIDQLLDRTPAGGGTDG